MSVLGRLRVKVSAEAIDARQRLASTVGSGVLGGMIGYGAGMPFAFDPREQVRDTKIRPPLSPMDLHTHYFDPVEHEFVPIEPRKLDVKTPHPGGSPIARTTVRQRLSRIPPRYSLAALGAFGLGSMGYLTGGRRDSILDEEEEEKTSQIRTPDQANALRQFLRTSPAIRRANQPGLMDRLRAKLKGTRVPAARRKGSQLGLFPAVLGAGVGAANPRRSSEGKVAPVRTGVNALITSGLASGAIGGAVGGFREGWKGVLPEAGKTALWVAPALAGGAVLGALIKARGEHREARRALRDQERMLEQMVQERPEVRADEQSFYPSFSTGY